MCITVNVKIAKGKERILSYIGPDTPQCTLYTTGLPTKDKPLQSKDLKVSIDFLPIILILINSFKGWGK